MGRARGNPRQRGQREGETSVVLGSLTHVGMARTSNQDAYCAILAPNAPLGTDALLAVADGMGGHQAGEVASAMVIRGLVQQLSSRGGGGAASTTGGSLSNLLREVIQQVNAEVHQAAAQPETRGMGSTLTAAVLARTSLVVGHVGDSRAYLLRNGQLLQLSKDHSWVAEEVARGSLTPEAARTHPRRNILTRAMGTSPQVEVDTLVADVEEGDTLLLCSDGLHSLVRDEEIARILGEQPPSSAAQTLVEQANALGGNDNITVIVARVERLEKGTASPRQRRGGGEAKTVQVRRRGGGPGRGKRRLVLRILFLPIMLLVWVVKVLVRVVWAMLRFPFRRRG